VLTELDLSVCDIDDDGAVSLAKYLSQSSLKILNLDRNSIGDRGFASLLYSIPLTLAKLSVAYNQITESSLRTIFNFLATNRTLKNLDIRPNPFYEYSQDGRDDSCWEQINKAAKQNGICELN
jgi:hypothetical protein